MAEGLTAHRHAIEVRFGPGAPAAPGEPAVGERDAGR
jgi:hypothetical protein